MHKFIKETQWARGRNRLDSHLEFDQHKRRKLYNEGVPVQRADLRKKSENEAESVFREKS